MGQTLKTEYKCFIENNFDAMCCLDQAGYISSWNKAAEKIFAIPSHEITQQHITVLFAVEDRIHFQSVFTACKHPSTNQQQGFQVALTGLKKNGENILVEITLSIVHSEEHPLYMVLIRELNSTINSNNDLNDFFTQHTLDVLEKLTSGKDMSDVYDAICQAHESMHPRMRSSILRLKGKHLYHCSSPSLPEEYSRAIDGVQIGPCVGSCGTAAFLAKKVIVEDIATDPLWAEFKGIALPHQLCACWSEPVIGSDGQVLGTFAMYFDHPTTPTRAELKEIRNASGLISIAMEKEARELTLSKLSQAIEQAGEYVIITDALGLIEYVNPSFTRMTGYSADEVIGKNPRVLKSGIQPDEYYKKMWSTISNGEIWSGAILDCRKDGSTYPAIMSIAPILDKQGNITHYVGFQQDMTDHELLKEQLHQSQKLEALGTLVGGIAHDFNNILAGMTGNIYLAKKKVHTSSDLFKKLDNIEKLSFRAAGMIKQLLTFARKGQVSMQPIQLNSFIEETLKFMSSAIPENIQQVQYISNQDICVNGDGTMIHQVLMNLINNARDAVEFVDYPKIIINLEEFYADSAFVEKHSYFSQGYYAHLFIEDNGSGISEQHLEHVYEPFFTTKEQGKGTGLGLSMVFGAMKIHSGFVEVESVEGKGSIFHIYLPLIQSESIEIQPEHKPSKRGHKKDTILLVDDLKQIIETGKEVLESLGYQVLTAFDGQQAVNIYASHGDEINLVIMDIVMPVMSGDQAATLMRHQNPNVKIIFSTGYDKNTQNNIENELVLSKPFLIEDMSQLIQQELGK